MEISRKLFWLTHRWLNGKRGFLKKGITIDIIPTTRCNYKCSYCPMFIHGEVKRYEECSFEEWKEFLSKRIQHWVSVYYISGGEPALYKDIVPLTNWLIERGHHVIIMTNLTYPGKFHGIRPHWRLMFMPTYHSEFSDIDCFKDNVEGLKERGYNVTSQQVLQNDGKFNRIKEFFTVNWFENLDDNLQAASDSPRTLRLYTGCINVFKK